MTGFNLIRINIVIKNKITKNLKFNSKRNNGKRHYRNILSSNKVSLPKILLVMRKLRVGKIKRFNFTKAKRFYEPRLGSKMGGKNPSMHLQK
jgi:hypothetical protein